MFPSAARIMHWNRDVKNIPIADIGEWPILGGFRTLIVASSFVKIFEVIYLRKPHYPENFY